MGKSKEKIQGLYGASLEETLKKSISIASFLIIEAIFLVRQGDPKIVNGTEYSKAIMCVKNPSSPYLDGRLVIDRYQSISSLTAQRLEPILILMPLGNVPVK